MISAPNTRALYLHDIDIDTFNHNHEAVRVLEHNVVFQTRPILFTLNLRSIAPGLLDKS